MGSITTNNTQSFYDALYERLERSEMIGYDNSDLESVLASASMIIITGLKKFSPKFTGNLANRGINGYNNSKYTRSIEIIAPGFTDIYGNKLPDYGWQTDMLDRLKFRTQDGGFINTVNKNKGWVENSVYGSLRTFVNKHENSLMDNLRQRSNNILG